jgi:hypothetical protein
MHRSWIIGSNRLNHIAGYKNHTRYFKDTIETLFLSNIALIWWDSQKQVDLIQHGKIISSWIEFTSSLRNKFYPLSYMKTSMIAWQHLRQGKGKNVQAYTHEFKRKELSLGSPLHTPETLLKSIGGMQSYFHHTILMFNPTNIDEVSVQDTHLEASKGKHVVEDVSEEPHEFEE